MKIHARDFRTVSRRYHESHTELWKSFREGIYFQCKKALKSWIIEKSTNEGGRTLNTGHLGAFRNVEEAS